MGIRYREKGPELHEEIERQGHTLAQVDGQWVADDPVAVQHIIDDFGKSRPRLALERLGRAVIGRQR